MVVGAPRPESSSLMAVCWTDAQRHSCRLTTGTTLILPLDAPSKAPDSPGLPLELQSYKTQKHLQIVLQAWAPIPCRLIVRFHCRNVHVFQRKEHSTTTAEMCMCSGERNIAPPHSESSSVRGSAEQRQHISQFAFCFVSHIFFFLF